jgi:hypothetical protein
LKEVRAFISADDIVQIDKTPNGTVVLGGKAGLVGNGPVCPGQHGSFCEYADIKPRKTPTWFALDDSRPLAFFGGIWTTWHGTRGTKANLVEGEHQLFGFLTTDANAEVGAIHPKAMPVILTAEAEIEQWMTALAEDAL